MLYFYSCYYIASSYGISIAYEIVYNLCKMGQPAKVVISDGAQERPIPSKYDGLYIFKEHMPQLQSNDLVVYNDTVSGNPLGAKNVVRYMLNKPMVLTGEEIEFSGTDFILAYSYLIDCNLPQLYFLKDDEDLFASVRNRSCKSRGDVAIYFGKVRYDLLKKNFNNIRRLLEKYKNFNVITRSYPANRSDTLSLVAKSDLLISFDPLTNLNYEATLLGTPVLLVDNAYNLDKGFNIDFWGFAFSQDEIDHARKDIDKAWPQYKEYLANQNIKLSVAYNEWCQHFANDDPSYINNNISKVYEYRTKVRQDFLAMDKIQYVNILKNNYLPLYIRKTLGLRTECNYNIKDFLTIILLRLHLLSAAKKIKHLIINR